MFCSKCSAQNVLLKMFWTNWAGHFELNILSRTSKILQGCYSLPFQNFSFFHRVTVWRNEKFSLTEKKFRQITYLVVISLVKPMLSRKFCEKSVRENICNFHIVRVHCGNYRIFRQINVLLKNFRRKIICVAVNFSIFHTVWVSFHLKNISWNH